MARAITTKGLLEKTYKVFEFTGSWSQVFGHPERGGLWIMYGPEKNYKTTFALRLAEYLTSFHNVLYISAEEGLGKDFQAAAKRVGLDPKNSKIKFHEYIGLDELRTKLSKRQSPRLAIIDNITVYVDELKNNRLRKLATDFPEVTFIFLAHEEKNEPYTATAKLCRKLAKIIIRLKGSTANVSGRCPGGTIIINDQTAMLYHGTQILETAV